ncbi:hypothetical protein E4U24_003211 [Claviceps purpurea]|nr:hypothetical protein E4U24_003211 [Claviceps purpurea]
MWPFSNCGADSCTEELSSKSLAALLPLAAVFVLVNLLAVQHIFPKLSGSHRYVDGQDHYLPAHAPLALRQAHAEHERKSGRRRGAAWAFGTTVSLAVMLGLLILGEILQVVDPAAKNVALRITVPLLLFLLVALVPWLQCRAIVASAGWSFQRNARGSVSRMAWVLQLTLFGAWLFSFWTIGHSVPHAETASRLDLHEETPKPGMAQTLTRGCLERVGVVGICLMALLAGFASVSTPWHTLMDGPSKKRPVTDADINRKQAGLEASSEMLITKRHQLQQLERRALDSTAASEAAGKTSIGLVGKLMGALRPTSGAEAEMRVLRIEIAGLESMEASLASHLSLMQNQRAAAVRASTLGGRITMLPSHAFAAYCIYRILATLFTTLRRRFSSLTASSPASFASSDPISRFLGLLARHWDPALDQLAWARTISFVLSGFILLASANSVLQTLHLFSKWTPGLLRLRHAHSQTNLALAVGQITATYVISASLLLRSQLPARAGGAAVAGVLHGALSPAFVDRWFETWFLLGSLLTGLGIWMGRKLMRFGDEWEDDLGMEEMGAKRS